MASLTPTPGGTTTADISARVIAFRDDSLLVGGLVWARDGKSFYYELVLERSQRTYANLHRYRGDRQNGEKREAVPFVLTHDAIVKLVTDIIGAN